MTQPPVSAVDPRWIELFRTEFDDMAERLDQAADALSREYSAEHVNEAFRALHTIKGNSFQLNQNFSHLPVQPAPDKDGKPLYVHVDLLGRQVRVKVWKMAVGRITLFMLDTDIPENTEEDRLINALTEVLA